MYCISYISVAFFLYVEKKHGVGEGDYFSNPMLGYAKALVLREFFYVAVR